jgi:branched-chain amino acid aminotransferase
VVVKGPVIEGTCWPGYAWLDGAIVAWEGAVLHVDTHCVLGGLNAYEMIGGFWSQEGEELRLFRAAEHFERLRDSAKMMRLPLNYADDELLAAALELLARNEFREDVGLRVVAYLGQGRLLGYAPAEISTGVFMIAKPIGPVDLARGIHVSTGIWGRLPDVVAPPRLKSGANYQNVRLAQVQARIDGYDDVILLNSLGKATELPIANLFIVREGVLITPDVTSGILEGITRRTVLELAAELGLPAVARQVDRSELYLAEEAFASTSLFRLTPILSVDRHPVGSNQRGPLTSQLQAAVEDAIRGRGAHHDWLTPVYRSQERLAVTSEIG